MNHSHGTWAIIGLIVAIIGIAGSGLTTETVYEPLTILWFAISALGGAIFGYNVVAFIGERD